MAESYYDLGTYCRPITTSSVEAKKWFDRGLIWSYGFHHEEASACFERAIAADRDCAMAHWGLAYSLGPNYNKAWDIFDPEELGLTVARTHQAVMNAKNHASGISPVEEALIDALISRYPREREKDVQACAAWNESYAESMSKVYEQFRTDLDVAMLYAEALMNLSPWALYDLKTGEPAAGAHTVQIKAILDAAIALPGGNNHPGLLHLYTHLMEMSKSPETALPVANRLRGLVPDSGHLQHMPTHLDLLCGDWQNAIKWNSAAIIADEKYLARAGAKNFYTLYRSHDYHFRIYAAMFAGQKRVALDTTSQLEASITPELLNVKIPPMAEWLEGFLPVRTHVMVRFGMWQDIIAMQFPGDKELYCMTTAMIHYAKGIAYANSTMLEEAQKSRDEFKSAKQQVPESRRLFNNTCQEVLAVADAMLDAELEFRKGAVERSFQHFELAIERSDHLHYEEPWGWMQPPRHAYGALLLEHADIIDPNQQEYKDLLAKALHQYSSDLGYNDSLPRAVQHPNNVWALHGYCECLTRAPELSGKDRSVPLAVALKQLEEVKAFADVPIHASCACRKAKL
ncbi:TPR domain protein [Teratosphaeria nubilosa]|uniref:TPR domain protein n=1 Tax=Teratosphaeria nubilosa TaxID=161662 RepID=A0A6G1LG85_9PEZI|nr:TPR domain protein [Teratosphaeria nubilosa]